MHGENSKAVFGDWFRSELDDPEGKHVAFPARNDAMGGSYKP